jgi:hypothetical protein
MQPMANMVGPMMAAMVVLGAPACIVFVVLMVLTWRKRKSDGAL